MLTIGSGHVLFRVQVSSEHKRKYPTFQIPDVYSLKCQHGC